MQNVTTHSTAQQNAIALATTLEQSMKAVTPILAVQCNTRNNDQQRTQHYKVRAELTRQQQTTGSKEFKDILALAMVG